MRGIRQVPSLMSTDASFDAPFGLLEACHERVLRTLDLLQRLHAHVLTQGVDEQARQAACDVMRYFDIAAPLHHANEELHVFPPLLAGESPGLAAHVRRLQREHIELSELWLTIRPWLQAMSPGADAAPSLDTVPGWDGPLRRFAELYVAHIEAEHATVYPAAERRLSPEALTHMRADMMLRRGVSA